MRSKNRLWSSKKEKEDMRKSTIESHNGIKILLNSNTYLSSWRGIKLNDTYKNLQFDFKKNNPIVNRIGMGLTCLTRFSPLFVCTSLEGCHQNLQMTGTRLLFYFPSLNAVFIFHEHTTAVWITVFDTRLTSSKFKYKFDCPIN